MVNLIARRAMTVAAGLALAGGVAVAPAFAADPVDNQIVQITAEKACGTVTVTLANKDIGEYGFTWSTVPGNGGSDGVKSGLISVASNKTVTQTIRFDEDSYAGVGAFTLGVTYGPNTAKQKFVDVYPVDTNCLPPATPTATPTPTPPVTVTPTPTTPVPLYADCAAVRAAGKAPLGSAENGYRKELDRDGDGLACENIEGTVLVPDDDDNGPAPSSINTGRR